MFQEATTSNTPGIVSCKRHGDRREAFVCRHLLTGTKLGFFQAIDPSNPYPDAWCANCERIRMANGGEWPENSKLVTPIALVCGDCYQEIKGANAVVGGTA